MSCNCKTAIEAQLTERFKAATPDARHHTVTLQGYGFTIVGNVMQLQPFMTYTAHAEHALKKGGSKKKTSIGYMHVTYCPFCGVKVQEQRGPGPIDEAHLG